MIPSTSKPATTSMLSRLRLIPKPLLANLPVLPDTAQPKCDPLIAGQLRRSPVSSVRMRNTDFQMPYQFDLAVLSYRVLRTSSIRLQSSLSKTNLKSVSLKMRTACCVPAYRTAILTSKAREALNDDLYTGSRRIRDSRCSAFTQSLTYIASSWKHLNLNVRRTPY